MNETNVFPRNVAKQLSIYNVQIPRRAKALTTPHRKSQISHETCNILSKWTTTSCPRRIKVHVINQQGKEHYSTCRRAPVSLDEECARDQIPNFSLRSPHFKMSKDSYYILQCSHATWRRKSPCAPMQKRAPYCVRSEKPHACKTAGGGNRVYIALGSFIIFIVTVTTLPWREEKDFPAISTAKLS
jgi:hypothetical protein